MPKGHPLNHLTDREKRVRRRLYERSYSAANRAKKAAYDRHYRAENREKIAEGLADYKRRNVDKVRARQKRYATANREKINARKRRWNKTKYHTSIWHRVSFCYRARINVALRRAETVKKETAIALVGCSIEEFMAHLEGQFQPGMTWANYGTVWEIDHRTPVSSFDLSTPEGRAAAFHYENCQPLFAADNRSKGAMVNGRVAL